MKKLLFTLLTVLTMMSGCAQKQLIVNGLVCPAGRTEELVQADFQECRYYDMEAAAKASKAPMSIECQKCLENKGYKIEQ